MLQEEEDCDTFGVCNVLLGDVAINSFFCVDGGLLDFREYGAKNRRFGDFVSERIDHDDRLIGDAKALNFCGSVMIASSSTSGNIVTLCSTDNILASIESSTPSLSSAEIKVVVFRLSGDIGATAAVPSITLLVTMDCTFSLSLDNPASCLVSATFAVGLYVLSASSTESSCP